MTTIATPGTYFLDTYTGTRTAGEPWVINGSGISFTVRTDTRVYSGAPAAMTGSLAVVQCSASLGGSFKLDASNVRWMAFDTGAGTVPAIGTMVTQNGVTGYLLGVWSDLIAAPVAVGGTMPASGFMKFREVTGGTFTAGSLTNISASASSPDVVGWIEVVFDVGVSSAIGMGEWISRGDWFSLGVTSGTRGQILQTPANGGGTTTTCYGVQIETAPGSGVYEWFPTTNATTGGWSTTHLTTDQRAKFVEGMASGQVRIGSDGTNNIGYLPPAGCNVRIPNIIGRTCTTAARAVNIAPPTSVTGRMALTAGGRLLDLKNLTADWALKFVELTDLQVENCCIEGYGNAVTNSINKPSFTGVLFTVFATSVTGRNFSLAQGTAGANITNCKGVVPIFSNSSFLINAPNATVSNLEITGCRARTSTTVYGFEINDAYNVIINNLKLKGTSASVAQGIDVKVTNVDYVDSLVGATATTNAMNAVRLLNSSNTTIDGITFGDNGVLANTHSYLAPVLSNANTGPIKIRNMGTRNTPITFGLNTPQYLVELTGNGSNIKVQRMYGSAIRGGTLVAMTKSNSQVTVESCYAGNGYSPNFGAPSSLVRGSYGPTDVGTISGLTGANMWDYFVSNSSGRIRFVGNVPNNESSPYFYLEPTSSSSAYFVPSQTAAFLPVVGDSAVCEMTYFTKGHTGFANSAPVILNGANLQFSYQLDTGNGYGGTWKVASAANLSSEPAIDPSIGVKMKIRAVCITAGVTQANNMSSIVFTTNSSLADQVANLYPLDVTTLSFEGLAPGSEVRAYVGSLDNPAAAVEIGGIESTSGSTWSFTHTSAGQVGYIMIFAMGYQPVAITRTYQATDSTLLIQQVIDRNYFNPA